jgi:hypothetical protein
MARAPCFSSLHAVQTALADVANDDVTARHVGLRVVVEVVGDGEVNLIIERKGRVWEGTERKDAAVEYWCEQVSNRGHGEWRYVRINQSDFDPAAMVSFRELVYAIEVGSVDGSQS